MVGAFADMGIARPTDLRELRAGDVVDGREIDAYTANLLNGCNIGHQYSRQMTMPFMGLAGGRPTTGFQQQAPMSWYQQNFLPQGSLGAGDDRSNIQMPHERRRFPEGRESAGEE